MAATVVGSISATQANSKEKIVAEPRRAGYSTLPIRALKNSWCHVERNETSRFILAGDRSR